MDKQWGNILDELVRDLTKVGSIPKSDAYRRIKEFAEVYNNSSQLSLLAKEVEGLRKEVVHTGNEFPTSTVLERSGFNDGLDAALSFINKYRKE